MRDKLTPQLPPRLQAPELLQRVHPHLQPRERAARDVRDRGDHARRACAPPTACEHPIDVLVLATGFKVFEKGNMPPFPVRGVGGLDLAEFWDANRQQAYEGVSVPGVPELVLDPRPLRLQRPVLLRADRDADAPHRALPGARARRAARPASRSRPRPTGATSNRCSRAAATRSSSAAPARTPTATTSTSTATCRSGPSLTLEAAWRSARFDLDDYTFAAAPTRAAGWSSQRGAPRGMH